MSKRTKAPVDNGHAKYSPSSAYRWLACPGSIKLCEKLPDMPESEAAANGTKAHGLAEALLRGTKVNLRAYDKGMLTHVKSFVNWVHAEKKKDKYDTLEAESKIKLDFIHPELGGTADVTLVKQYDSIHLIDLKYGVGYVDAKRNPQLMTYMLGLAHKYHYDFLDYHCTIYQPRYKGRVARTDTLRTRDLKKFETVLRKGIDACEKPGAPLIAGSHCHFCKAKYNCEESQKKAVANAASDFDNVDFDDVPLEEVDDLSEFGL